MGLFDKILNQAKSSVTQATSSVTRDVANATTKVVSNAVSGSNHSETFTFATLPTTPDQLMALPEATLDTPYKTAALAIVALLQYESNPDICFAMLDALRGPAPMSPMEKNFISERLNGKTYKVKSFFAGATVENNYEPTTPYTITVSSNPYSFPEENWATMHVKSSGADSSRPIKLRKKPSTNQWFINDIQCLSDIRIPVAQDEWA